MKLNRIHKNLCFIPDWGGNLSLPDHERVKVFFDVIPTRSREAIQANARIPGTDVIDWVKVQRAEVSEAVKRIENLEIDGVEINTGQKLMDCEYRPEELVVLVAHAIHMRTEKALGEIKEVAKN